MSGRVAVFSSRPVTPAPGSAKTSRPAATLAFRPLAPTRSAKRIACELTPTVRSVATSNGLVAPECGRPGLRGTISVPGDRDCGILLAIGHSESTGHENRCAWCGRAVGYGRHPGHSPSAFSEGRFRRLLDDLRNEQRRRPL